MINNIPVAINSRVFPFLSMYVLLPMFLMTSACSPNSDETEEYMTLNMEGEPSIDFENLYGSFDDGSGHLYLSGTNSDGTNLKLSIFGYELGETGTFRGEDYTTSTDCADIRYQNVNYTSGEYTGDNPESYAILEITDENGEMIKGSAEGLVESWQDPNETISFTAEFVISLND